MTERTYNLKFKGYKIEESIDNLPIVSLDITPNTRIDNLELDLVFDIILTGKFTKKYHDKSAAQPENKHNYKTLNFFKSALSRNYKIIEVKTTTSGQIYPLH